VIEAFENRMAQEMESAKGQKTGRLAWSLALFAIGGSLVAFAIGIFFLITTGGSRTVTLDDFLIPIPTAAYAIVGGLVASKHPRNLIGWIFIAVSWLYGISLARDVYQAFGLEMGATGSVPALADNLWIPRVLLPTLFVFLLFPDGTHLSRRWEIIFWLAASGLVAQHIALALHPGPVPLYDIAVNPDGYPALAGMLDIVLQVTRLLLVIGLVGAIAAFVIRLRRSKGIERQQMKWLSFAISLAVLSFVFGTITWSLWPDNPLVTGLSDFITEVTVLGIAVATGIAILRYRLYDIDLVINRTLVYGALTVIVVLIYVLLVGGLGALAQVEGSLLTSLVATGLIAVIFQPLRERLQRAVNRLTFGDRDEPFEALERLGRRLEGIFSPEMVYPTIVETVAHSLKLPYVAIAMQRGEELVIAEAHGSTNYEPLGYPLLHQGEVVGQLLVGRRSPEENFTEADERLLHSFARQVGTAVHAVQLTADLQRSRQSLVTAREEERLRLRRDLHDGLGPVLASVIWQTDGARDIIHTDPSGAAQLLEGSVEQAQAALADIRRLVYGLRPPALDELGLVGALEQAARGHQQISVTIESPTPFPSLPAAVEVAAYRIIQEALKNAIEHGKARNCVVCMSLDGDPAPGGLCLTIHDDGLGLPQVVTPGVGLVSMRERAEELGGAFAIHPRQAGGTQVEVQLPLD
jgi:signal transduction histidine kinase